jgi:tetratricopeptide (TPR) repeat protein
MIHQEEKSVSIELTIKGFKAIEGKLLDIGDMIPLVEGDFRIDLLMRNTNSKEFSSVEGKLVAPAPGQPALSPILFLWEEKAVPEVPETTPFLFYGRQLYPNAKRVYSKTDNLVCYIEIYNPSAAPGAKLRIRITDQAKVRTELEEPLPDQAFLIKSLPLQDYLPGYYTVTATLTEATGRELSASRGEFALSHLAVPRPWSFNKLYPPLSHAYFAMIRARQYLEMEKNDLAILEITPFHDRTNPNREIAKVLARANFQKRDYPIVIEVLEPLMSLQDFEIQELAGKSYFALKDYPRAVERFKLALTAAGEVVEIINLIGYSYLEMAKTNEALRHFERSLSLFSDQPKIREIVNKIKKGRVT